MMAIFLLENINELTDTCKNLDALALDLALDLSLVGLLTFKKERLNATEYTNQTDETPVIKVILQQLNGLVLVGWALAQMPRNI
ncbi:hypothetical protein V6259_19085 [Marinomonas sp. TI.3.20]|uniref:hypothetical protein n=1 Tax=Marinomonas sp. TI.3.20 TaxID=3121296 RepID=UPI00311E1E7C